MVTSTPQLQGGNTQDPNIISGKAVSHANVVKGLSGGPRTPVVKDRTSLLNEFAGSNLPGPSWAYEGPTGKQPQIIGANVMNHIAELIDKEVQKRAGTATKDA